ncbi:MAG: hypothetical protein EXX96DRAFT_544519 [Benjaminiella poitrasii]|nr:MAG: hypothetical protein EXX96DRAFT_544519 [Benjaminiella poitrasii]
MSFQSIILRKEIWKSQRLLAKLCHNCLAKRTPILAQVRRNAIMTQPTTTTTMTTKSIQQQKQELTVTPHSKLLDSFRQELYQASQLNVSQPGSPSRSRWLKNIIFRRDARRRLMTNYQLLKKHQTLVSQLTQKDIDRLVSWFVDTIHCDDPRVYGNIRTALHILEDLKSGTLFPLAKFRLEDAEKMIYLVSELGQGQRADDLLEQTVVEKGWDVSMAAYEAAIRALSKEGNQNKIDFWLSHLQSLGKTLTSDIVRSAVLCRLTNNQLEAASEFLKQHHPGEELSQIVHRWGSNSHELLDQALNRFAIDCKNQGRLNEMRLIYMQKRRFDMSTVTVVRNMVTKSIYTDRDHLARKLLENTIYMKDISNTQLCAKKLIQWYISTKNLSEAMGVWEELDRNGIALPLDIMQSLLVNTAKAKHQMDTMRLYRKCKELYPGGMSSRARIYVLHSMVLSKEFQLAYEMSPEIESIMPYLDRELATMTARTMFSLCAHTGKVDLFERIFAQAEQLKLSVTHEGLTSLIACYLTLGDVNLAKAAFQAVAAHTNGPDVVDFNLLLRIIAMEDQSIKPDRIYEVLDHMSLVSVAPDETTLRTMLDFYDHKSEIRQVLFDKLLEQEKLSRFDQVFLNNIALMNLMETTGVANAARVLLANDRGNLFKSQKNKPILCNGLTFKILLDAATKNVRYANIAEKLYSTMRGLGMKPSHQNYEGLIFVLTSKGKIKKARRYIQQMEDETGIKADANTYLKLAHGLLKLGKPHLAKEVIMQDMLANDVPLNETVVRKLKYIESSCQPKRLII